MKPEPKHLPHDLDAEMGVIGGILLDQSRLGVVTLDVDDFYDPRHKAVFGAMRSLEAEMRPIDVVTVGDALGDKRDVCGEVIGLAALRVPTHERVDEYASIVKRHSVSRRAILELAEVVDLARRGEIAGDDVIHEATQRMARIETGDVDRAKSMGQIVKDEFGAIYRDAMAREEGKSVYVGVPTSLTKLDKLTGGIPLGLLTILAARPGHGKCLAPETPVIRFDGRVCRADDVREGDVLMGPDSKPRTVLGAAPGRGPMFRIVPTKGQPWVCNDVHVLTLVSTDTGEVIDIALDEYLARSERFRTRHKLFKACHVAFSGPPLPIDPYFLGLWFGDGTKETGPCGLRGVSISKPDAEVRQACELTAARWGLRVSVVDEDRCPRYCVVGEPGKGNPLLEAMRELVPDVNDIPHAIRTAPSEDRAAFLAGFLDADGHTQASGGVDVVQKRPRYADGVEFIARSLGLCVTRTTKVVNGETYERLMISGDIDRLPMRIPRKLAKPRIQTKNCLRTGFTVEPLGEGGYFGFELDGDGRFLLGDFTVTHNTTLAQTILRAAALLTPDTPVMYTYEDGAQSFAQRELADASGVSTQNIRAREFMRGDLDKIDAAARGAIKRRPLLVEAHGMRVQDLVRDVRRRRLRAAAEGKSSCGLVIVDYLQRMPLPDGNMRTDEKLGWVCDQLVTLAASEHIAVIACSQLNRGLEKRDDKRPQLADLRDSGKLEELCKLALFLYREHKYNPSADPSKLEIHVGKNHNGEADVAAQVFWNLATHSIMDAREDLGRRY